MNTLHLIWALIRPILQYMTQIVMFPTQIKSKIVRAIIRGIYFIFAMQSLAGGMGIDFFPAFAGDLSCIENVSCNQQNETYAKVFVSLVAYIEFCFNVESAHSAFADACKEIKRAKISIVSYLVQSIEHNYKFHTWKHL